MDLDDALALLARDATAPFDLAEVALLLARDEYPALDVAGYLSELNGMAREAQSYLRGSLEARVEGLCRYLFHELGFRGNRQNYYDPRNSYFSEVLDRRTGIPITLSAVAMAVGQRAGLDVQGVGLPGHFLARASAGGREVLFDPFHGGRRLTRSECETLVYQVTGLTFHVTTAALEPVPLQAIVLRMLTNLKGIYLRTNDFRRAARVLARLRQLVPHDPLQRRDLGVCLLQAGKPGQAIDHLAAYLASGACGDDAEEVRGLLNRARDELAHWN